MSKLRGYHPLLRRMANCQVKKKHTKLKISTLYIIKEKFLKGWTIQTIKIRGHDKAFY